MHMSVEGGHFPADQGALNCSNTHEFRNVNTRTNVLLLFPEQ